MGERIHGYPVLQATCFVKRQGCRPTRAVLLDKEQGEFVTAMQCEGDREWFWGHYIRDRAEALADYARRADQLLGEVQPTPR